MSAEATGSNWNYIKPEFWKPGALLDMYILGDQQQKAVFPSLTHEEIGTEMRRGMGCIKVISI